MSLAAPTYAIGAPNFPVQVINTVLNTPASTGLQFVGIYNNGSNSPLPLQTLFTHTAGGIYRENVVIPADFPSEQVVAYTGDTRTMVGVAFVQGQSWNEDSTVVGVAGIGGGTGSIASLTYAAGVITFTNTGAGAQPNFLAVGDSIVIGDFLILRLKNAAGDVAYFVTAVTAVTGSTLTVAPTVPAGYETISKLTIIPNVIIAPDAGPALQVLGSVSMKGFHLAAQAPGPDGEQVAIRILNNKNLQLSNVSVAPLSLTPTVTSATINTGLLALETNYVADINAGGLIETWDDIPPLDTTRYPVLTLNAGGSTGTSAGITSDNSTGLLTPESREVTLVIHNSGFGAANIDTVLLDSAASDNKLIFGFDKFLLTTGVALQVDGGSLQFDDNNYLETSQTAATNVGVNVLNGGRFTRGNRSGRPTYTRLAGNWFRGVRSSKADYLDTNVDIVTATPAATFTDYVFYVEDGPTAANLSFTSPGVNISLGSAGLLYADEGSAVNLIKGDAKQYIVSAAVAGNDILTATSEAKLNVNLSNTVFNGNCTRRFNNFTSNNFRVLGSTGVVTNFLASSYVDSMGTVSGFSFDSSCVAVGGQRSYYIINDGSELRFDDSFRFYPTTTVVATSNGGETNLERSVDSNGYPLNSRYPDWAIVCPAVLGVRKACCPPGEVLTQ